MIGVDRFVRAVTFAFALAACGGGGGGQEKNPPVIPAPLITLPQTHAILGDPSGRGRDDGGQRIGVAWPTPRFETSTDGTVTDHLTGLMWLADANCMRTQLPAFDTDDTAADGAVTWVHALMFMSSIPGTACAASYGDWRLPNILELETLLDWGRSFEQIVGPGIFANVQLGYPGYWVSTSESALGSELYLDVENGILESATAGTAYVLPVRGGSASAPAAVPKTGQRAIRYPGDDGDYSRGIGMPWPEPRFTTMADGSVRDGLTGLYWAPDANLMLSHDAGWDLDGATDDGMVTWVHALDYVELLGSTAYLGHADWRLPNVVELGSLYHYGYAEETCGGSPCASPSDWLDTQGFSNVQGLSSYWSSTAWARDPYNLARVLHSYAYQTQPNHVWPVRGP
ncbi:MAG TPA: DUF1566 domain-containing protein [Vicinamibacteria bacterium]|nr:DUF1566 domain-containing protein [Vicinamibacteria bacterium]